MSKFLLNIRGALFLVVAILCIALMVICALAAAASSLGMLAKLIGIAVPMTWTELIAMQIGSIVFGYVAKICGKAIAAD